MAETSPPAKPGRGPRVLRVVLFVSLALNLLVAGLFVGAVASGRAGPKPPQVGMNLGPIAGALEEQDRRVIIQAIRSAPDLRPPSRRERRRDVAALIEIMRTEPFDADRFAAILADQRENGIRVVTVAHEVFVAHMATVGPERRAAFADRLEAQLDAARSERDRPGNERDRDKDRGGD